jgi:hypothetical protein
MTVDGSEHLLELLDIQWPIIQAPMAGTGTPALTFRPPIEVMLIIWPVRRFCGRILHGQKLAAFDPSV